MQASGQKKTLINSGCYFGGVSQLKQAERNGWPLARNRVSHWRLEWDLEILRLLRVWSLENGGVKNLKQAGVHFISLADLKKTPWKNGQGLTTELKIFPENSSIEKSDYLWRISVAEIHKPSVFSAFPSYERLLVILEGEGVDLEISTPEPKKVTLQKGGVARFSGEDKVFCQLTNGAVKDLGLIYCRDSVGAGIFWQELGPLTRSFAFGQDFSMVYLNQGSCRATLYPGESVFDLYPGRALLLERNKIISGNEFLVMFENAEEKTTFVAIEITLKDFQESSQS